MASREGDTVERFRVVGGASVTEVTEALDLLDRVACFGTSLSFFLGDADVFVFDLVFLAGPVAGPDTVCIPPTL